MLSRFFFSRVGDSCTTRSDCAGNYTACTNGVCTGVGENVPCISTADCNYNLYCDDTKTCQPLKQQGQTCDQTAEDGDGNCEQGLLCSYEDNCITPFSKAAGSNCLSFTECQVGMTCNVFTSQCSATPWVASTCDDDSDCSDPPATNKNGNFTCECNFWKGRKECAFSEETEPQIFLNETCKTKLLVPSVEQIILTFSL